MERKGPIHIQILPTNTCNLQCEFCGINNHNNGEMLKMDRIKEVVEAIPTLLSAEISGGGEPTLYPHLSELINYLHKQQLKIGMVSNGIGIHKIKTDLSLLTWLRVSVNGFIDHEMKIDFECVPSLLKFGISYVVHKDSNPDWKNRLTELMLKYRNIRYCRVTDNVYDISEEEKFEDLGNGIFYINKPWGKASPLCYQGSMKFLLAPNGGIFGCCVVSINEGFYDPKYSMTIDQLKNFIPMKCPYKTCIFSERNKLIEQALQHYDDNLEFV
jgi:sulfatase maturation enzyme AslB (radical SAM superfamily)